jgi:hypothetical protein
MSNLIPVEGHSHLYRDENTGAIINADDSSYQSYIRSKKLRENEKREIEEMKSEIKDIKNMLSKIVEKL